MELADQENMKYDVVLIVTCIDDKYIQRMMSSVTLNNHHVKVLIIFINQSGLTFNLKNDNTLVHIVELKCTKVPLSRARNIGINYLSEHNSIFLHAMFPDDDSTFSDTFFTRYKKFIKLELNYLIDVYCEGTVNLFKKNKYQNGSVLGRNNYNAAMSVNLVISYKTFFDVGLLDERIGVGSKYGAGEDTDYYIRACDITSSGFIYKKAIFNFHPSSTNKFSKMKLNQIIYKLVNYGNGVIFVLCKHKMHMSALKTCFRAIGGAFLSLLKFEFKLFVSYLIAFFSRIAMLIKCIVFSNK